MTVQFVKATKKRAKARIAIDGPSGSGKTYTALVAATVLAEGGRIAVVDTERGSASLYSDKFAFDVVELSEFNPRNYVDAIEAAESGGYAVIVLDSLSHAWEGEGGALDLVDRAAKRSQAGNTYTAWKDVTPLHRKLVDAMLQSPCHIVATMRSKTEYVLESVEKNGRTVQMPRKVGMAPIQRQGMEYEFTLVCDMDIDHNLAVSKSRCDVLADKVEQKPGAKFFRVFLDWLNSGDAAPAMPAKAAATPAPAPAPEPDRDPRPMPTTLSEAYKQGHQDGQKPPAPPANGQAKKPISREAVDKRWRQLWRVALDLGLAVEPVAGDISTEAWVERGKQLGVAIYQRAKDIVNTHPHGQISMDDTDEQILAQALRLRSMDTEATHATAA